MSRLGALAVGVVALALAGGCAGAPEAPVASTPTPVPAVPCVPLGAEADAVMHWSAAEREVLRTACDRIPTLRRSTVTVTIVDERGRPVAGVPVRVEQQRHLFPFGAHPNEAARGVLSPAEQVEFDDRFFALFNQVIWGMPWRATEPAQGTFRADVPERGVQYATRQHSTLRGHALVYVQENPPWFSALSGTAQRQSAEARVRGMVAGHRGRVGSWVVVNEAKNTFGLDSMRRGRELFEPLPPRVVSDIADYADPAFRWAKESDPSATLIINDNGVMGGRHLANVEAILAELKRRGTPFDAVGIQAHMRTEGRVPLDTVAENLRRLAPYGRLHVTELSVPARPLQPGETVFGATPWDGWSEETQAAYAVALFTLTFGDPAVDAIAYWAMTDRRSDPPTNGAGLLRADLTPRPAYEALRRLLRETWWTRWSGQSDNEGRVSLPMFFGEHTVTVSRPGQEPQVFTATVTPTTTEIRLTLR